MAEVLTFLGFASNKLSAFLAEERRLLGGLRQEVQLISDEFGHIKAFLEKFADSDDHKNDPQLCEWIRQVRDVSYDTEDIIDEFLLLFAKHSQQGFLGSVQWNLKSVNNLPARHRLASKLQEVKARIRNISEARLRYESHSTNALPGLPGRLAADIAWRHSKDDDALLAEEAQLVGINLPKKQLISHLLDVNSQGIRVIAVLGMGGLGKTTLVRKVHDDAAVTSHFHIHVWVTVSKNWELQDLLKDLIQQVLAQFNEPNLPQMDSMNIYQLKALLKEFLQRGRYAIVFDDVWDRDFWNAFKFVFPENIYGCNCVMLTTRMADVASASSIETQTYVYKMKGLNSRDSWTLFCRKIFKDKHCPDHLKNVAESIVTKCRGLPLAIFAIGGLLASKDSSRIHEWELVQHRLRDEFEGTGKLDRVKRILSLSYNDLPSTLKACLLYTSIFPQRYRIRCFPLILHLVDERFVEEKEGQTAEEIAWDCLKELANRSLIQLYQVDVYNGLSGFIRIHDLLREFIATKSRDQNMVTIITSTEQVRTRWTPGKPGKVVRRVAFDNNPLLGITSWPESYYYINNCRSIIHFGKKESLPKYVVAKLLTSKLLTVVDLRGMDLEEIPEEIFSLYLLHYLAVSGKSIQTVPKSIKRLLNLEYLILAETDVTELPMEIQKLHKLHHLTLLTRAAPNGHLIYNGFKVPCGMGKLLLLQTLYVIDAAQSGKTRIVNEIGKLAKLRKLKITNLRREDGKELCSSLENLNNLQELGITSSVEKEEAIDLLDLNHPISASSLQSLGRLQLHGRLEKMPAWLRQLHGLEMIVLDLSNLADDPLETLQHLANLSQVVFTKAYQGESLCFKAKGFLKLKKLYLQNMKGLKHVRIKKGAMPGINELTMGRLPLLEELPIGIKHLRQLQRLELRAMSSKLTNKLKNAAGSEEEISEESKKISHVPRVFISCRIDGRWKSQRLSRKKKVQEEKETKNQLKFQVKQTLDAHVVPFGIRASGTLLLALAIFVAHVPFVL